MIEPGIVMHGRRFVGKFKDEDFRSSLIRAFRGKNADHVALGSNPNGQPFPAACAAWGIDRGLLYVACRESGGQQAIYSLCLTEKGEKEILGPS